MAPANNPATVLIRRPTSDNITVLFWDDGAITDAFARYPRGIGPSRQAGRLLHGGVVALVAQVCGEYPWADLPKIIRTARAMMAGSVPVYPQDIRDVMAGKPDPAKVRCVPVYGYWLGVVHDALAWIFGGGTVIISRRSVIIY